MNTTKDKSDKSLYPEQISIEDTTHNVFFCMFNHTENIVINGFNLDRYDSMKIEIIKDEKKKILSAALGIYKKNIQKFNKVRKIRYLKHIYGIQKK